MKKTLSFSKREAIKFGWETLKKNFGFLVSIIAIYLVISFVPDFVAKRAMEINPLIGYFLYIGGYVLMIVALIGLVKISLKLYDNEKAKVSDIFSHYRLFFKYLIASIVYALIVLVGLILLIVPGIIFMLKYYFFDYFVVDKGYGPIEALKKSAEITKGNRLNLFMFILLILFINILGMFFFFIGLIITIPITILATAFVYRKLSEKLSAEENIVS